MSVSVCGVGGCSTTLRTNLSCPPSSLGIFGISLFPGPENQETIHVTYAIPEMTSLQDSWNYGKDLFGEILDQMKGA